jgi:hypothetical protein
VLKEVLEAMTLIFVFSEQTTAQNFTTIVLYSKSETRYPFKRLSMFPNSFRELLLAVWLWITQPFRKYFKEPLPKVDENILYNIQKQMLAGSPEGTRRWFEEEEEKKDDCDPVWDEWKSLDRDWQQELEEGRNIDLQNEREPSSCDIRFRK